MTQQAYDIFYRWSVEQHTVELMEQKGISWEEASKEASKELSGMLPDGLHTENNFLLSIVDDGEIVGFIWTLHEETGGKKQSFLCDFAIWEEYRRKGYGAQALLLMEKQAAEAGCRESVLFVADRNLAARALYKKCGYCDLRQAGCGWYMIKELKTDLG
jgi:ribosomal protein S18 acetylase RimI-like enzyme